MSRSHCLVAAVGVAVSIHIGLLPSAQARTSAAALPQIGVTYTHASLPRDCDLHNKAQSLLKTYHWPGVRKRARLQLAAMRAAGIDSIRILVWHLDRPAANDFNNLPSEGGRLGDPYRTNLIKFASDVRDAGFKSMVVEYSPQWTSNPIGYWGPNGLAEDPWIPAKLEENWQFIRDTRGLIKRYGPAETWFDPASEMAPNDYVSMVLGRRLDEYVAEMYRRYVAAYGKEDIVFFVIAKGPTQDTRERYAHLIAALRSVGVGMPTRFGVHPDQSSPADLVNLRETDADLAEYGLDQPLMIGEMVAEGPNSAAVAKDIARFANSSKRIVAQVYLWFWRAEYEPNDCRSAPYRADSYITAFTGSPVSSTLSASVRSGTVDLRTPYGHPVVALTAGQYALRVADGSRSANFHLVGPKVDKKTRVAGRTSVTWAVRLIPGVYRFGSDSAPAKARQTLTVLSAAR